MNDELTQQITSAVPRIVHGWCTVEKAIDLAAAVLKLKAKMTVEVGVFGGCSLIPMALAHASMGSGIVMGIDPWEPAASVEGQRGENAKWWGSVNHEAVYQQFMLQLRDFGVEQFVTVVRKRSDEVTPPEIIDLLHFDGNHGEQTINDVERFAKNVRLGGMVFMDDIGWDGGAVQRGVDLLKTYGFTEIYKRDTGAMFERTKKAAVRRRVKVAAP